MSSSAGKKIRSIESATSNMTVLIDDMVKKSLKSFRATGDPKLDARFLKESISALRELYELMMECGGDSETTDGIIIKMEEQLGEWSK